MRPLRLLVGGQPSSEKRQEFALLAIQLKDYLKVPISKLIKKQVEQCPFWSVFFMIIKIGLWRRLVARSLGVGEVEGSNPFSPTT